MSSSPQPISVDQILQQWRQERPDLDVSAMGTLGRVKRCAAMLQQRMDPVSAEFGLSAWEFDMLATLRRSGAPFCLAPTDLFRQLMVSSGTMTHRLQRLESAGWIERKANPDDARSMLVQLTPPGLALIDSAVSAHVDHQHALLAPIKAADLRALEQGLSALIKAWEGQGPG